MALNLRQSCNPRFYVCTNMVFRANPRKCEIMNTEMRAGAYNTHASYKHIKKLGKFINATFSQPGPALINSSVTVHSLRHLIR